MPNFLDCFLHWSVPPMPENVLAQADAVAVHEFGDQQTPSKTTVAMVRRGVDLAEKYNIPLICQYPGDVVAEYERVSPFAVITEHKLRLGEYLDTEEVNRQVAQVCSQYGWKRVIICTHPHHLWRAGQNMERQGLTPLYPYTADIPYDHECTRRSLRTPWMFIPREILARGLYLKKGYI